jgi:hypothetical protein
MYDIFYISSDLKKKQFSILKDRFPLAKVVTSFSEAKRRSFTKFFWVIFSEVIPAIDFNFDYKVSEWELDYVHVFPNGDEWSKTSVFIFPKHLEITNDELDSRLFINKKEHTQIASYTVPYDVVFISFHETFANKNFLELKKLACYNLVYWVDGVKGIHNAHKKAAEIVSSDMFWVVDADAKVVPTFNFNMLLTNEELDIVHVWKSKNPVNNLEYGYGGVKLLPRQLTLDMDLSSIDMTTSISNKFKSMPHVSNITAFNTDALSTWRSAFRECVKLSSRIIVGQNDVETENRLSTWITESTGADYSEYAKSGASAGKWFGTTHKDNPDMLSKINDYDWLAAEFEQHIKTFPPETFK